ncbi:MAG TPA: hypothetical protein VFI11_00630 [Anaerolineales bacterium]|nr:hypothetical protein [Anaerolineales bacterium]
MASNSAVSIDTTPDIARLTASLCMVGAGLMHFLILPEHVEHATGHAWFFAIAGALQVVWGAIGWRANRRVVDGLGMALAATLILLWGVTRVLPPPFSNLPEEIEGAGILSKSLEAGAFAALLVAVRRERGMRLAAWAVGGAVVAAFALYAGGRLAGPLFPSLWAEQAEAGSSPSGVHTHVGGQRVRIDDKQAGPWIVRVLTSPVPPVPGNFLVEVRVRQEDGGPTRKDVEVWIEARPDEGPAEVVRVAAVPELAKIPGEVAAQVPVPHAGIWLITVTVDGPEGRGEIGFAERISGSLGLGAWMSALLPFGGLALLVIGYAVLSRAVPRGEM